MTLRELFAGIDEYMDARFNAAQVSTSFTGGGLPAGFSRTALSKALSEPEANITQITPVENVPNPSVDGRGGVSDLIKATGYHDQLAKLKHNFADTKMLQAGAVGLLVGGIMIMAAANGDAGHLTLARGVSNGMGLVTGVGAITAGIGMYVGAVRNQLAASKMLKDAAELKDVQETKDRMVGFLGKLKKRVWTTKADREAEASLLGEPGDVAKRPLVDVAYSHMRAGCVVTASAIRGAMVAVKENPIDFLKDLGKATLSAANNAAISTGHILGKIALAGSIHHMTQQGVQSAPYVAALVGVGVVGSAVNFWRKGYEKGTTIGAAIVAADRFCRLVKEEARHNPAKFGDAARKVAATMMAPVNAVGNFVGEVVESAINPQPFVPGSAAGQVAAPAGGGGMMVAGGLATVGAGMASRAERSEKMAAALQSGLLVVDRAAGLVAAGMVADKAVEIVADHGKEAVGIAGKELEEAGKQTGEHVVNSLFAESDKVTSAVIKTTFSDLSL